MLEQNWIRFAIDTRAVSFVWVLNCFCLKHKGSCGCVVRNLESEKQIEHEAWKYLQFAFDLFIFAHRQRFAYLEAIWGIPGCMNNPVKVV